MEGLIGSLFASLPGIVALAIVFMKRSSTHEPFNITIDLSIAPSLSVVNQSHNEDGAAYDCDDKRRGVEDESDTTGFGRSEWSPSDN